jgi:NET1-associated nuclear protein 1 (U3 small nucleolar RNA-associated protein 17)
MVGTFQISESSLLNFLGHYLVSGGLETVLVIWQLSTGKQQSLPHLTAAVEKVVVSPRGAAYALLLANNSALVLSTSELEAKANIIGIQSRRVDPLQLPSVSGTEHNLNLARFADVPMVVDPKTPTNLLFCVPPSQPRRRPLKPYAPQSFLQTFDLAAQQNVSRQALTRNNTTEPNIGPGKRSLLEPNTHFIQISPDGEWLASIDQWMPPAADMGHIEEGVSEFNEEERSYRREVYLKFWHRDENKSWALQTRIDAPHLHENVGASAQIHDLVSNPRYNCFVSVGDDQVVRFWKPKTRRRNGVIVRGADKDQGLVNWSLAQATAIKGRLDDVDTANSPNYSRLGRRFILAFSKDGSVLAVAVSGTSGSDTGVVHILDAESGAIRRSITEFDLSVLSGLSIVGRYLIIITDCIAIWDLVVGEPVRCSSLEMAFVPRNSRHWLTKLASNDEDGTFALACAEFKGTVNATSKHATTFKKTSTRVLVFDPRTANLLWTSTVPDVILSLVAAKDSKGYIALDASAFVRRLIPKADQVDSVEPTSEFEAPVVVDRGIEDAAGEVQDDEVGEPRLHDMFTATEDMLPHAENDKPVVRPEQLQRIFDVAPSHALPPVKDLLSSVVELYARKPRTMEVV